MDENSHKNIIEIWKTIVGVQQHFNDIAMKIRGLFVTLMVAIAAAQGFLLEKQLSFPLGEVTILYATFMPLLAVVAAYLFYFMDRYWYHRLLMGAVLQGGFIEQKYGKELPELGLGSKITEQSNVELKNWIGRKIADWVVSEPRWKKTGKLHSEGKIELFYKSIVLLFLLWFAFTVLFVGIFVGKRSIVEFFVLLVQDVVSSLIPIVKNYLSRIGG